jgi:RimJ/RimL family protein N-acetyltransferase
MTAPSIETDRLVLRPHRLEDETPRAAMVADPETMRHLGGPMGGEDNWTRLLRYAGHWQLFGWGPFAVIEKASGRFAGEIGLMQFRRGMGADFDPFPEAMWLIARWAEGQGYAGEAMRAAIADHAARHGPERLVCVIGAENTASIRLAERLGFTPFDERPYKGRPCLLLATG